MTSLAAVATKVQSLVPSNQYVVHSPLPCN